MTLKEKTVDGMPNFELEYEVCFEEHSLNLLAVSLEAFPNQRHQQRVGCHCNLWEDCQLHVNVFTNGVSLP